MIYCFDLDGTLCTHRLDGQYHLAAPFAGRIERVRRLYDEGHTIIVNTARGSETGIDWRGATAVQLSDWGVPYHRLLVGEKPAADFYIDDRAVTVEAFFGGV